MLAIIVAVYVASVIIAFVLLLIGAKKANESMHISTWWLVVPGVALLSIPIILNLIIVGKS